MTMVIYAYKQTDLSNPVASLQFGIKPESLRLSEETEWRVRHIGRRLWPKARWRRRMTTKLELSGRMPFSVADYLRQLLRLPFTESTRVGCYFTISGLEDYGVSSNDLWVPVSELSIESVPMYSKDSSGKLIQWCNYKFTLQKVGVRA